jgi:hypothetical protein
MAGEGRRAGGAAARPSRTESAPAPLPTGGAIFPVRFARVELFAATFIRTGSDRTGRVGEARGHVRFFAGFFVPAVAACQAQRQKAEGHACNRHGTSSKTVGAGAAGLGNLAIVTAALT